MRKTNQNKKDKIKHSQDATIKIVVSIILFAFSFVMVFSQAKTSGNKADENLKSAARVNPSTLAMEFSIPLGNYPNRGLSLPISIDYSSKVWKMEAKRAYVDYYNTGNQDYRSVQTTEADIIYGEHSASGWTSSLIPPKIVEENTLYNQDGDVFLGSIFIPNTQNIEQHCGWYPFPDTGNESLIETWCYVCFDRHGNGSGVCWDFPSGGGPVPTPSPSPTPNPTPVIFPTPDPPSPTPTPVVTPTPTPTPQIPHLVKRIRIEMPDGATKEFRKDDTVYNCFEQQQQCLDLDGRYYSVDGSQSWLQKNEVQTDGLKRDVLYMPDGSKYIFSQRNNISLNSLNLQSNGVVSNFSNPDNITSRDLLIFAEKFIDKNGNLLTFDKVKQEWTDTMNRNLTNPLPTTLLNGALTPGNQEYKLKGINNQDLTFTLSWQKLKPPACEDTNTNCGDGALELDEELFYAGNDICATRSSISPLSPALFQGFVTGANTNEEFREKICNYGSMRFNPVVLAGVTLPDGRKYIFKYNKYGEISKIIYPTGSFERFDYDIVLSLGGTGYPYSQANRGVKDRWVYNADGTLYQHWDYDPGYSSTSGEYSIKVTDPAGFVHEKVLSTSNSLGYWGFEDPAAGAPKEEIVKDANGNHISRSLTKFKVDSVPVMGGIIDAKRDLRPVQNLNITFEKGKALAQLSTTEYDDEGSSDALDFAHLKVKRKKTYHYKVLTDVESAKTANIQAIAGMFTESDLASVSENSYLYDSNYRERGIIGLPAETRVLNPANPNDVLAKTEYEYDQPAYPLIDPGSAVGYQAPTGANAELRGNVTTTRAWVKETNTWLETHAQYDKFGNLRKAWDISGDPDRFSETVFENSAEKPYQFAYPTKVITPAPGDGVYGTNQGSWAETTYDFNTGLSLTTKNEFGQITATDYDSYLRPVRSYGQNFAAPETQTIYGQPDSSGQLPPNQRFVKVRKQIDENNWDEAVTWFDGLGRTIKATATDSQGAITTETKYDALGRVEMTSNPYRAGDTVLWSKIEYDEIGRAAKSYAPAEYGQTGASLGVTSFDISTVPGFVGTVVTSTDASDRKSRSITNALGQVLRVDEATATGGSETADLGSLASPHQPTFYKYDVYGKMVKVLQGVQSRYFQYDPLGRLLRVRQPEQEVNTNLPATPSVEGNSQWTAGFVYDIFGNIKRTTDAGGVNIISEYDKANRPIRRCYTKPNIVTTATECSQLSNAQLSDTTPTVENFYDGYGLGVTPPTTNNYAKGKLTKVTSSISETRYTKFDSFGRLEEMEQRTPFGSEPVASATPQVSKYKYDFGGRLIEETYPSGRVVKNSFEADGDLANIVSKAATQVGFKTFASNFTYTATGLIDKLQIGSGRWETAKFNTRNQITELALGTSPSDTSLWKLNYEYGELNTDGTVNTVKNTGNIAKQTISYSGLAQPFVQTYRYDSLYRITEAKEMNGTTQTWMQNWSYDRYGNRIGFAQNLDGNQLTLNQQTLPSIDPNTNRFTDTNYHYDKAGNLVNDPKNNGRVFTFNGDNKQTEVRDSSITPTPSNPDANLIGRYYYDGEGKRVKKVTNTEITVFVYSSGKLVAEYSTELPQNPTTSYVATDTLQSVRAISDKNGNIISRRDFMPFGEELYANTANRTTSAKYSAAGDDGIRKKFTGYEKDKETGLDFAEARYYNNAHGRFTAVDPLLASGKSANPQTFNRYVYVMNSPLIFTDSSGLQAASNPNKRWYVPGDPNGIRTAVFAETAPEGYTEATCRNKAGDLISPFVGGQSTGVAGSGREDYVIRFNPAGPRTPQTLLDVRTGQSNQEYLSDYERNGWEIIKSDDYMFNHPATGALQNAIEPHDIALALTPFKFSVGGRFTSTAFRSSGSPITLAEFGTDAAIVENSANLIPKKGWYDAVVHGTKDGLNFTVNKTVKTPSEFYEMMLQNGYQPGTNIRLMSCYAGSCSNGAAQQLSNLSGAKVVAPADEVFVGGGDVFIRGVPYVKNDKWFSVFQPK